MKLELKENMYVRTEEGKIFKTDGDLIYLSNDKTILHKLITRIPYDTISYKVVKASYNIIDLIEKNDYINGSWVNEIVDGKPIHEDYNDPFYSFGWENEEIQSVITHEQMKQMSYKIGE